MSELINQIGMKLTKLRERLPRFGSQLSKSTRVKLALLAVIVVSVPVGVFLQQQETQFRSKAQAVPVRLFFSPAQTTTSTSVVLKLFMDAQSNQVGFTRVEFVYDQTKLALTQEVQTTSLFKTGVSKTTMAEANATGKVVIVLGLAPEDRVIPPTGVFEFAQITLQSLTSEPNLTTTINLVDGIQLVDMQANTLTFSGENATIILNPVAQSAVAGKVTDSSTAGPIAGATVNVFAAGSKGKGAILASAVTNSSGDYIISINAGSYDVEAGASGYSKVRQTTTVSSGATATLNFSLPPKGKRR